MKKIIYITGNEFKLYSANVALAGSGFYVEGKKINCPEIQADTIEEVASYSSKYASDLLGINTLKNDTGLIIESLNNFPGPYTKFVEEKLGEEGILKLLLNEVNRKACFYEVYSYTEKGKEPINFISKTEGTIALEPNGSYGWGYDKIFIPNGKNKTLACFDDEERAKLWDNTGLVELVYYLNDK